MLQNAYFLAKIGADTAENERNFAQFLPKICDYPTGPLEGSRTPPATLPWLRLYRYERCAVPGPLRYVPERTGAGGACTSRRREWVARYRVHRDDEDEEDWPLAFTESEAPAACGWSFSAS